MDREREVQPAAYRCRGAPPRAQLPRRPRRIPAQEESPVSWRARGLASPEALMEGVPGRGSHGIMLSSHSTPDLDGADNPVAPPPPSAGE
jgi:hypothetical protein